MTIYRLKSGLKKFVELAKIGSKLTKNRVSV